MSAKMDARQVVNFNKIACENFVFPNQTRASITAPVDGQVVFEGGKQYNYSNSKNAWIPAGSDGIGIRGTVGTDASHPEWLTNLPEEPSENDAYYVGVPGSYGPVGGTKHGDVGDLFYCITEKTSTTAAVWGVVPSGNGRFAGTITGDGTNTDYTLAHPLATDELIVSIYDSTGASVMTGVTVTTTNIVLSFGYAVPNTESYKVVVIAG